MKNSNKFNQETGKRPTTFSRTSLKDLSDFHPRLSTRASFSSKITEDSDSLALSHQQQQQQQQQQSISTSTDTNEFDFQLRSEDLMANLTQYVGSDGLIKESVDIKNYAQLMQCETGPSQQILLLKIIVATLNSYPNISEKLVGCESLMIVIGMWLSSVQPDNLVESLLVGKILEVLTRLTFTVDQLVKYKFGRIVKKIVQLKDKHENNQNVQLAHNIYNLWNTLVSKSEITTVPRRKSEDENNLNFNEILNQTELTASQIKSQQDHQAYEIGRKRSISISTDSNLTEESDEKKIKLNISTNITDKDNDNDTKFNSIKIKKKVRFPNTAEKLCKVILFQRAPEEYEFLSDGSASRDSYLHADLGEASKAFELFKDLNDCEELLISLKPWKTPVALEGSVEGPEGSESEEKIIQQQRERTVLSVTYFNNSDIPSTPLEAEVDTNVYGNNTNTNIWKTIPIRANETIVKHQVSIKTVPMSLVIPAMFNTTEVFTNFMSNNSSLNALMNPFASVQEASPITFNNFYDPNTKNNIVNKYNDNNHSNGYRSYTSPEWNPYRQESQGQNRSDFKRSNSFSTKTSSEEISGYSYKDKNKEFTGRRANSGGSGSLARSKKINCRHYRPGRPDSCELGSSCRFAHQDHR